MPLLLLCSLCTLFLSACAGRVIGPDELESVVESIWVLERIEGKHPLRPQEPNAEPITLELSGDGRAVGFAGANRFFGQVEITPEGEIRFGPLGTTRRYLDEPTGLMDQENRLLEILSEVDTYRVHDERLILFRDGRKMLIYRASPPPAQPDRKTTPG